jgi:peptide/nickel transport system substrate-binding protein
MASLALLAAACSPAAPPPSAPATTGGNAPAAATAVPELKLRVGIPNLISTMDPHASIGGNPRRYGMYECLLGQDETGKIEPALASEWKNLDTTTWQFKLAPGRKFSDGNPVTIEDVKYSFDRVLNPDLKLAVMNRVLTIDKTEAVDSSTFNITTKGPDPLLAKRVATVAIVEKAYTEKLSLGDFGLKGLGAGPFMQTEFVVNDHLTMAANPYYPKKPGAVELTIRQVPESSARIAGLRTGELDIAGGVPVDQADTLKAGGTQIVVFGQGASQGAYLFQDIPNSPTNDKRVRLALNYGFDKESIAKNIYKGYTKPEDGQLVQSNTFGYNPNVKTFPYDPAMAKKLLADAGYANGFKMKVDVLNSSAEAQATWLFIQSQWKDIGVDTELNMYNDNAIYLDWFYGRRQRDPVYSVALTNAPAIDADFALIWFSGKQPEPQRVYNNPDFDAAYVASTTELDETKRKELLQKAIQVMHDDPPYLFLIQGFGLYAARPDLVNIIPRGDGEPKFDLIKLKGAP